MKSESQHQSLIQITALILLRWIIGWHFAYEGIAKLFDSNWSAYFYLLDSKGWFPGFFINMATNPFTLAILDPFIKWSLVLIGLSLIIGFLTRYASIGAMGMLLFFWLSHPPFIGMEYALPAEGHYLVFDKNSVEFFALLVILVFPTEHIIGIQAMLGQRDTQSEEVENVQ